MPAHAKPNGREQDIKKAYTHEQLAEVGAITLIWNQVELKIDWLILITLKLSPAVWLEVAKRINGMDGKIAILRKQYALSRILNDQAKQCIKLSLDAVAQYKIYRDAIVHSLIFDAPGGIAQRIGNQAKSHQILVTLEALKSLYERLDILKEELQQIDLLYRLSDEDGAKKVAGIKAHYEGILEDPIKMRRERDVPIQILEVQKYQNKRMSLPPLPFFPD